MPSLPRVLFTRFACGAVAGCVLFLIVPPLDAQERDGEARPPHVLMIAIDDLRPMLGCYGDETVLSPSIDRLAAQGRVFERAYCQYSKCGPSRLSLLTGLRPDAVGIFGNRTEDVEAFRRENPDLHSLPRWFRKHGYHTRSFGKISHDGWEDPRDWSVPSQPGREREMWEIADREALEKVPFEDRDGVETLIADRLECPVIQAPDVPDNALFAGRMTGWVKKALAERAAAGKGHSEPFFFAVGFRRPHLPFVAPKSWFDRYTPDPAWLPSDEQRLPPRAAPILGWFNSDGYVGTSRNQGFTMPAPPETIEEGRDWAGYEMRSYLGIPNHGAISEADQLAVHHAYRACISYVDDQIGQILQTLDEEGLAENTVVVLWSDHGWHLGEHATWSKMTNYEIGTRVPLLLSAPGERFPKGKASRSLVELVDLYPTLCELAGLPQPDHLAGRSLVPILEDPDAVVKDRALSEYHRYRSRYIGKAVRTDRYRFVEWTDQKSGEIFALELYDHESDPGEQENLAGLPESKKIIESIRAEK